MIPLRTKDIVPRDPVTGEIDEGPHEPREERWPDKVERRLKEIETRLAQLERK